MNSPAYISSYLPSPHKRRQDSPVDEQADEHIRPSCISTRGSSSPEGSESDIADIQSSVRNTSISRHDEHTHLDTTSTSKTERCLTRDQHKLLQQWYEDFAKPDVAPTLHNEQIVAFATAIRSEPKVVVDYVEQRRKNNKTIYREMKGENEMGPDTSRSLDTTLSTPKSYTIVKANKHLAPTVLPIVERYVSGCSRRRSQNDGRRSVNTGPYRCTFGCGYRTKRAFDWRRHEETHEPQELWLCQVCGQNDTNNPFLVNRKDKFLKHVADKHADLAAEAVLDKSKLEFVPRAELDCRYCGEENATWDERCRHVLGHFEDEVERSMKRVKVVHENRDGGEDIAASVESSCDKIDDVC